MLDEIYNVRVFDSCQGIDLSSDKFGELLVRTEDFHSVFVVEAVFCNLNLATCTHAKSSADSQVVYGTLALLTRLGYGL